jgi:hypothetical protein
MTQQDDRAIPVSEAVRLRDCPPGLFRYNGALGLKTDYRDTERHSEAYVAVNGEAFWGGAKTKDEREELLVEPIEEHSIRATQAPAGVVSGTLPTGAELREAVAKLLYEQYANHPDARWDLVEDRHKESVWRSKADAILKLAPPAQSSGPGATSSGERFVTLPYTATPEIEAALANAYYDGAEWQDIWSRFMTNLAALSDPQGVRDDEG